MDAFINELCASEQMPPPTVSKKKADTPVLVVCGPTASGKTDLALHLSHLFDGEMVCADSMQIYEGLPVGTATLMPEDAQGIPQHLTAFLPPEMRYSVADYVQDAQRVMADIALRGKLPVVCGGTGLYIESLITGRIFTEEKPPQELRQTLQEELALYGPEHMLERLKKHDPEHAQSLHISDTRRILRALEQQRITGKTYAQRAAESFPAAPPYKALCLGITFKNRQALYERIDARVDLMMEKGLLAETKKVYMYKNTFTTAAQAIGYKEFFPYFENAMELSACVEKLKQATRRYAKRQLTWFGHMKEIVWLYADEGDMTAKATEIVRKFRKECE